MTRQEKAMTEDRTEGRQEFIKRVLALEAHELSMTRTDAFDYQGDTYSITVTGKPQGERCIIAKTSDQDMCTLLVQPSESLEDVAFRMWDGLESARRWRILQIIDPHATCEGGKVSCRAIALWAFRIHEEDAWAYACGRHLTVAMTQESEGLQAEFTVCLIKDVWVDS
jgi:hypothetical protein